MPPRPAPRSVVCLLAAHSPGIASCVCLPTLSVVSPRSHPPATTAHNPAPLPPSLPHTCSACEVYNEELSDLLAPGASGLQIRDGDQHQGVFVEGLTEHVVVNGAAGVGWGGVAVGC